MKSQAFVFKCLLMADIIAFSSQINRGEFRKGNIMSFFNKPMAASVAIAALLGTTMLATPLTAARADTAATNGTIQLAQYYYPYSSYSYPYYSYPYSQNYYYGYGGGWHGGGHRGGWRHR